MSSRNLQNLRGLQAVEAVARCGSFVGAAAELHVTPAAVGQQVRAVEEWLGTALFTRLGTGSQRLQMTDRSLAAMADLREGFDRLAMGVMRMKEHTAAQRVTVSASHALAARWLLPRLDAFTATHPGWDVRLDISDRLSDLRPGDADVGIRCGAGRWAGVVAHHLRTEEVFPVCAPALAKPGRGLTRARDLQPYTLIHDATVVSQGVFPTWAAWLRLAGVKSDWAGRGLVINSSAAVLQAAVNGQGVALGRALLTEDDRAAGRLVRLLPSRTWPIPWSYYVVHRPDMAPSSAAAAFVAWLKGLT